MGGTAISISATSIFRSFSCLPFQFYFFTKHKMLFFFFFFFFFLMLASIDLGWIRGENWERKGRGS